MLLYMRAADVAAGDCVSADYRFPHACIHACIHTYSQAYICTCMHTYTHTHVHTYMHMYVCTCVCVCVCMYDVSTCIACATRVLMRDGGQVKPPAIEKAKELTVMMGYRLEKQLAARVSYVHRKCSVQ